MHLSLYLFIALSILRAAMSGTEIRLFLDNADGRHSGLEVSAKRGDSEPCQCNSTVKTHTIITVMLQCPSPAPDLYSNFQHKK